MNICIIGAGRVGSVLGRAWASRGHELVFGMRDATGDKANRIRIACSSNTQTIPVAGSAKNALRPVDVGALKMARYLEPMALMWITLAYGRGWGPDFAFDILQRPERPLGSGGEPHLIVWADVRVNHVHGDI